MKNKNENELKVEKFSEKSRFSKNQFYGREKIVGARDLKSIKETPADFNPTVGGGLDLSSVKEITDGFNPTVC